jgi:hypothetical protein
MNLILWPAVITLAITLLRLVGELQGWSRTLFNPAAGGSGALVGISWLPPIFGAYFAWKLAKEGKGPANGWKVVGMALLSIGVVVGAAFGASALGLGQIGQFMAAAVASLAVIALVLPSWKALAHTMIAYAFAARIPVAVVMLFAILGKWGTHYDVLPPDPTPELVAAGPVQQWFWIGLVPQMTIWIGFTVVVGMLFGGLAAALRKPRPAA